MRWRSLDPRWHFAIVTTALLAAAGGGAAIGAGIDTPLDLPAAPASTWTPPATIEELAIGTPPAEIPEYDRDDWPHWRTRACRNTRNQVLVEESLDAPSFREERECNVEAGRWLDPYGGAQFTTPTDLDVDHLVPLENAHLSGGWEWDREERRAYANDLENLQHLLAVEAGLNRQKGSQGPERWRPPLDDYWCRYAVDWIEVKASYELTATLEEWAALGEMLATCPGGAPEVTD